MKRIMFTTFILMAVCAPLGASAQMMPFPQQPDPHAKLCYDIAASLTYGDRHIARRSSYAVNRLISSQTQGTFQYRALAQLGAPRQSQVAGKQPVPLGMVVYCQVNHDRGVSYWQVGIDAHGWIQALGFQQQASHTQEPRRTQPHVPRSDEGKPEPRPSDAPTDTTSSDACRRFPEMC